MKKLTLLLILLIGSLSYGQTIIYSNAPDRQKIQFDTITGDISLQNSPSINIGPYVKNNSSPLIIEQASNKTLGPEDDGKLFVNKTSNSYVYTVKNQATGEYSKNVGFSFVNSGLGHIYIKGESGANVDLADVTSPGKTISLLRDGVNSWFYLGDPDPWSGCLSDPHEINLGPNAASDPACSEGNSTTGFAIKDIAQGSMEVTTDSSVGTYAMKFTTGSGAITNFYGLYNLAATIGDVFEVSLDIKSTQGSAARLAAWTNCTGGPFSDNATSTYVRKTYTITATATGNIAIRAYSSGSSPVEGDNFFIDNLSIIKIIAP